MEQDKEQKKDATPQELLHLIIDDQLSLYEEQLSKAQEEMQQLLSYIESLEKLLTKLDDVKNYASKTVKVDKQG